MKAGADLVKIEGGRDISKQMVALKEVGIPVFGHIGHKPQSYEGGRHVVGSTAAEARALWEDACSLEEAGAVGLLMECVPDRVAEWISERITLPTIGIGAGPGCNGQVLVVADLLGWFTNSFRFLLRLEDFHVRGVAAAQEYMKRTSQGMFPDATNVFRITDNEFAEFLADFSDPTL
jgi:3-methyl-2-oxobutanoate hydroxymethyltransferase